MIYIFFSLKSENRFIKSYLLAAVGKFYTIHLDTGSAIINYLAMPPAPRERLTFPR